MLVGDETGTVVLRARDGAYLLVGCRVFVLRCFAKHAASIAMNVPFSSDQVDFLAPRVNEPIVLRNCGVAMYKGALHEY